MKINLFLLMLIGCGAETLYAPKSQFILPEPLMEEAQELDIHAFNTTELEREVLKIQLKIHSENLKQQKREKKDLARQLQAQQPRQIAPRKLFQN
jgi:hypothetical protein